MFPICERCGCETMTPDCGGWTPGFKHDCVEALVREEAILLSRLADIKEQIQVARWARDARSQR